MDIILTAIDLLSKIIAPVIRYINEKNAIKKHIYIADNEEMLPEDYLNEARKIDAEIKEIIASGVGEVDKDRLNKLYEEGIKYVNALYNNNNIKVLHE
ncbi:hypothetical protein [Oceanithermus sp.]